MSLFHWLATRLPDRAILDYQLYTVSHHVAQRCRILLFSSTWASIMVIINFFFGIIVFKEPVANVWGTLCSFLLLIFGVVGMSRYSSPQQNQQNQHYQSLQVTEDYEIVAEDEVSIEDEERIDQNPQESETTVVLFNGYLSLTERQCGILGAAFNGIMTGGSLIPLHYAAEEGFGGAKYFPSFGVGAMIANIVLWLLVYIVCCCRDAVHGKSLQRTFEELPKWHFRALWLPALLAGLLLSLAMFSTILAITYLGQGVGNSIVQSKILVSGLWGIFWYKEVIGAKTIAKWFASAGVCMIAIIWLSLERLKAKDPNH